MSASETQLQCFFLFVFFSSVIKCNASRACGYFCSLDELSTYERVVQLDVARTFRSGDARLCQHHKPCALRVSCSDKNNGRPYFTCRERWPCTFFCCADLEVTLRQLPNQQSLWTKRWVFFVSTEPVCFIIFRKKKLATWNITFIFLQKMLCYFLFHIKITLFWPHKTPRLLTAPAFFNFKEMILRVGHVAGPVSSCFGLCHHPGMPDGCDWPQCQNIRFRSLMSLAVVLFSGVPGPRPVWLGGSWPVLVTFAASLLVPARRSKIVF